MKLGFHVSIAGGISNSVGNAQKLGCTAFQIFSRNPRGWTAKPLDPAEVDRFKESLAASRIKPDSVVVHMPYLPNLSGPQGELYSKSVQTLAEELQRCSALGIQYLVIHLGSHRGTGLAQGISQLINAIDKAFESAEKNTGNRKKATVLLENNAGQTNGVGATFEDLATILHKTDRPESEIGICLDTCHLFASGYDISTVEGVEVTLEKFDKVVGVRKLKVIHLNDSKGELNSNLDRHQHIGLGSIGPAGLSGFVNNRSTKDLTFIMETPIDEKRGDEENLKAALGLLK
ncbi:MAG TPA: deoxyribonuclease IV [Nitrososphaera sp.]|nr:deoxyribonuclease IV [Nitrososphaera sp.]